MNTKIYRVINNMGMLLILLALVAFNLIIGGNVKPLQVLPLGIFTGLSFLLLFIKKIVYKEKLIKSKIDIAVTIFMGTLFLPLIFNTYCSLQGTVEFIQKYIFVYAMYLLVRNIVDNDKKVNLIIATTVASSLFIIILGFDNQYYHYFDWLTEALDLQYTAGERFDSTFGYTNAVTIYLSFCVFLSINRIENRKNLIEKVLYILYAILGSFVIIISNSRLILIIYAFTLFIYLTIKVYKKVKDNQKLLTTICVVAVSILLIFIIYVAITLQIPGIFDKKDMVVFRKEFEPNTEYTFTFDATVTCDSKDISNPQLILYATNEYLVDTEIGRVPLSLKTNLNQVKVKTTEDVLQVKFIIINNSTKYTVINHCYINGEEYIINYKYLPRPIYRLLTTFGTRDLSIVKRGHYYKNCLEMAKDSPIVGHGGNTWQYLSMAYEDHYYAVKESHSYFFELLISYGIIGVIAFTSTIVLLCKNNIKEFKDKDSKKKMLSIFIGLMLLILYNYVFDFGLSFVVLLLVTFIYIAMLQYKSKEEINIKIIDYIALIAIGLVFISLIGANIAKYVADDNKTKTIFASYNADYQYKYITEDDEASIEDIQNFISNHPYARKTYSSQNDMYKLYWDKVFDEENPIEKEKLIQYINFGIDSFEKVKNLYATNIDHIINRAKLMSDVLTNLEKMHSAEMDNEIQKLKNIIKKEYKINIEFIKDTKRNGYSSTKCRQISDEYEKIVEKLYCQKAY